MLKFFFILIILLIIFYLLNFNKNIDYFSNNSIKYLNANETYNYLLNDNDNYVNNFSDIDLYARKVKSIQDYLNLISNSALNFNDNQKNKLEIAANNADNFLNNYENNLIIGKEIKKYKWVFGLTGNNYEEGMPHTRDNIIFLSVNTINNDIDSLTRILIHEKIHIYQRYNYDYMEKIIESMGYTFSRLKYNINRIRSNPDLNNNIYKDYNGMEMIGLYKNNKPDSIGDIIITNFAIEHPYEKMAYEVSEDYSAGLISKYKNI
jgi:hypothetical protein